MPEAPTILVFDSGLGGLTVFREVKAARADARFVYLADDAGFPYGDLAEEELIARVTDVLGQAIAEHKPDLVVVACNTASTLALAQLRTRFSVPFVGTVPAIKPACAQSASKLVTVLGTQATVGREYTRALIREFASGCEVHLVGSPRLAGYAEAELAGPPPAESAIAAEIAGCFVERMDVARIRSCWRARIIRFCWSASGQTRPGLSHGSIRRLQSRAVPLICCVSADQAIHPRHRKSRSRQDARCGPNWPQHWRNTASNRTNAAALPSIRARSCRVRRRE